jgi:acetyl-CoA C-acetyltransferase
MSAVFVLGGFQTDFARNLAREGREIADLFRDVLPGCLHAAQIDAPAIETIHVGNAFGELFAGQAHLGAMPATVDESLIGVPASRHEAACASGSAAVLAAMSEIEAGRYGCALVAGVEEERNVPGDVAARHMGSAAWIGHEGEGARYMWPHMFSRIMEAYLERDRGLEYAHLAALTKKSFEAARANPNAQGRGWSFEADAFGEDDEKNPIVEGLVRRRDCSQVTDGAAAVVLCSADFAEAWSRRTGRAPARILGWGHRTSTLSLARKLELAREQTYMFPHVRQTLTDALARAGLPDASTLGGVEVHDCFSITEYMAIDHLAIAPPGRAFEAIESGAALRSGRTPINPSGGLIGGGHPVGATGVRMLLDAAKQVTGTAGEYQVAGARTFATLNIGGSAATAVSFVVGAAS